MESKEKTINIKIEENGGIITNIVNTIKQVINGKLCHIYTGREGKIYIKQVDEENPNLLRKHYYRNDIVEEEEI